MEHTWTIHSIFSEILKRVLMLHFTGEKNITFSMLLMTVSLMCSVLLLLSKNHITKKNGVMRLVNNTVLVNSAWTHVSINNEKGISVQGQDLYLLENFVWPTREKAIKKGTKTAGLFLLNIDNSKDMVLLVRFNFICTVRVVLRPIKFFKK